MRRKLLALATRFSFLLSFLVIAATAQSQPWASYTVLPAATVYAEPREFVTFEIRIKNNTSYPDKVYGTLSQSGGGSFYFEEQDKMTEVSQYNPQLEYNGVLHIKAWAAETGTHSVYVQLKADSWVEHFYLNLQVENSGKKYVTRLDSVFVVPIGSTVQHDLILLNTQKEDHTVKQLTLASGKSFKIGAAPTPFSIGNTQIAVVYTPDSTSPRASDTILTTIEQSPGPDTVLRLPVVGFATHGDCLTTGNYYGSIELDRYQFGDTDRAVSGKVYNNTATTMRVTDLKLEKQMGWGPIRVADGQLPIVIPPYDSGVVKFIPVDSFAYIGRIGGDVYSFADLTIAADDSLPCPKVRAIWIHTTVQGVDVLASQPYIYPSNDLNHWVFALSATRSAAWTFAIGASTADSIHPEVHFTNGKNFSIINERFQPYRYEVLMHFESQEHQAGLVRDTLAITLNGTTTYAPFVAFALPMKRVEFSNVSNAVHIEVTPQPARTWLRVKLDGDSHERLSLSLFDLAGKLVWQSDGMEGERIAIPKEIANGSYLLEAVIGAERAQKQIIIGEVR